MKKVISVMCLLALVLTMATPVCAAKETTTIYPGITLTIPEGYDVFTANMKEGDPLFAKHNTTKETVDTQMRMFHNVLRLVDKKDGSVITVSIEESDESDYRCFMESSLLSMEIIEASFLPSTVFERMVYRHSQVPFVKQYYSRGVTNNVTYTLRYCTTIEREEETLEIRIVSESDNSEITERTQSTAQALVDSIQFTNLANIQLPEEQITTITYTHEDSGITFQMPSTWREGDGLFADSLLDTWLNNRNYVDTRIALGVNDLLYVSDIFDKPGLSRENVDMELVNEDRLWEILEKYSDATSMLVIDTGEIDRVTYNGISYYRLRKTMRISTAGLSVSIEMPVTQLMHIRNGWMYMFQFAGSETEPLYAEWEQIMNTVSIPVNGPETDDAEYGTEPLYTEGELVLVPETDDAESETINTDVFETVQLPDAPSNGDTSVGILLAAPILGFALVIFFLLLSSRKAAGKRTPAKRRCPYCGAKLQAVQKQCPKCFADLTDQDLG